MVCVLFVLFEVCNTQQQLPVISTVGILAGLAYLMYLL